VRSKTLSKIDLINQEKKKKKKSIFAIQLKINLGMENSYKKYLIFTHENAHKWP
jgi:single-stranded DNA-specific DHH superfamily exonuclease